MDQTKLPITHSVTEEPAQFFINNIKKALGIGYKPVKKIFDRLLPVENSEGLLFDPETKDEQGNFITFKGGFKKSNSDGQKFILPSELNKFESVYEFKKWKNDDEISTYAISKRLKVDYNAVQEVIERLKPVEGQEGVWFDPKKKKDAKGNLLYFKMAIRQSSHGDTKYLKESEFEKFDLAYFDQGRERENELSTCDVAERVPAPVNSVTDIFKRFIPVKYHKNLYYDPKKYDVEGKPVTFKFYVRKKQKDEKRLLDISELEKFGSVYFSKERKNNGELSVRDLTMRLPAGDKKIRTIINGFVPSKDEENTWIDPTKKDKHGKPVSFHMVIRRSNKGETKYLMEYEFEKFKSAYFPDNDPKQDDEMSPKEISKVLRVSSAKVAEIFSRLIPLANTKLYVDPQIVNMKKVSYPFEFGYRKDLKNDHVPCLKENCLDLLAKQYDLKYRRLRNGNKPNCPS